MLTGSLAVLLSALFAGAARYVSFVEHPARATLDDRAALSEWQPSYKRGAVMQASLAMIAFFVGLAAWWQSGHWIFALGALFQILPWPWTIAMQETSVRTCPARPAYCVRRIFLIDLMMLPSAPLSWLAFDRL